MPGAVLLCAAFLQGFCGFGYSLLAMPLLLFMMPAQAAVPLLSVTGIALNAILLVSTRKSLDLRGILPLAAAGVAFTPLGAWLVREVRPDTAKTVIGAGVALISLALLLNARAGIRKTPAGLITAGAASGLLNGFSTFSGPPVVLLLAASGDERDRIRSTLAAYFLLLGGIGLASYAAMGIVAVKDLPGMAALLPFAVLGGLAGAFLAVRIRSSGFRRLSLVIMMFLGAVSAVS